MFARFNLKIVFLRSYVREVWHLGKANADHIRKAINGSQREKLFQNMTMTWFIYLTELSKICYIISFRM